MEPIYELMIRTSLEQLSFLLLVLVWVGIILYFLYKKLYEIQINKILKDRKKTVGFPSIRKVMTGYAILCFLILVIFCGRAYVQISHTTPVCEVRGGYSVSGMDLEAEIETMKKKGYTSFSYQKEKISDEITVIYAVRDKNEFIYGVQYTQNHPLQDNEQLIMEVTSEAINAVIKTSGQSAVKNLKEGKTSTLYHGYMDDPCDGKSFHIKVYNETDGDNEVPVLFEDTFQVTDGGIVR